MPSTIATPPMRGIGVVCTRGRSPPCSTPPMRGATRAVSEHRSYLVDVPASRYEAAEGRLGASTDYASVAELDALTICVPTPLSKTRTPDISYVVAAAESVATYLQPGQLVVLQSTTY